MESEDDVVHGYRPPSGSRFSPKSAFIPYCMDSAAPDDALFTSDFDDITCKDCQDEIVWRVNRGEFDELDGLDLDYPPSWLKGKF